MSVSLKGPLTDTTTARLISICSKFNPPDYIKTAASQDIYCSSLPKFMYADDAKTFPVNNPASTWVSAAFCLDSGVDAGPVVDRIKQAMTKFAMNGVWENMQKAAAESRPKPAPPLNYALPDKKKYPLDTKEQVSAAAEYLTKYASYFDTLDRITFANNVLTADDSVTVLPYETRHTVEVLAGLSRPVKSAVEILNPYIGKAHRLGLLEVEAALTKAANAVDSGDDPYELKCLVTRIGQDYTKLGIANTDELTALTPVVAKKEITNYVKAASGNVYNIVDLDKVNDDIVIKAFGAGPLVTRQKKAQLLEELGDVFEQVMKDSGVQPCVKTTQGAAIATTDWSKYT